MPATALSRLEPAPDWPYYPAAQSEQSGMYGGVVISNYETFFDRELAEKMKHQEVLAEYTAWNFHAVVWFADEMYYAEVSELGVHVATLAADTIEELHEIACDGFGYE